MGIYIVPNPKHFLALSGGTVSGGTYFSNSLSANTFFSGATSLEQIIINIASQYSGSGSSSVDIFIQPGLNTYTGGTIENPNINVSALTIDYLVVTGGSIFDSVNVSSFTGSGIQMVVADNSGNLSIQSIPAAGQSTVVRDGLNTYTAGTYADYSVNVSALTIDNISVSGNTILNSTTAFTISAGTIYSGGTDLYSIFSPIGAVGGSGGSVIDGINTFTAGTISAQSVNVTGLTIDNLTVTGTSVFNIITAQTISADTLFVNNSNIANAISSISNLGTGATVYESTSANTAYFRTFVGKSGMTVSENGNYLEVAFTGTTVNTDVFSANTTYVGIGEIYACQIFKVTSSGSTYEVLFAQGTQNYDKVWSDRYIYSYF